MRNRSGISYFFLFGFVLLFAGILLAQNTPDRALIVNGKSAGMVVQMGGHAYVDVETIAQFTNGSVTLEANRVVLTFPASVSSPAPSATAGSQAPAPPPGLSRSFASLAIAELAEMREWRGAIGTILTYGVPVVGTWPQDYHDRVEANLEQVGVAASTAADSGCDATPPKRVFESLTVGERRGCDSPVHECHQHCASRGSAERPSPCEDFRLQPVPEFDARQRRFCRRSKLPLVARALACRVSPCIYQNPQAEAYATSTASETPRQWGIFCACCFFWMVPDFWESISLICYAIFSRLGLHLPSTPGGSKIGFERKTRYDRNNAKRR